MEAETVRKDTDRMAEEKRLRKAVYDAVVSLTECFAESTLQEMLNNLDQNSWMEVVEERYLSRMCGFPLCTNSVKVKSSQKYRIDLKNKKVFERSAETDKFCCQDCFLRSAAIRAQLETEPLWIRGNQRAKVFDLNVGHIRRQQQNTSCFEFIDDQELVTSLEILKIGEAAESDGEDNIDETNAAEEKIVHGHEEFYSLCQSYLTMRPEFSSRDERVAVPNVKSFTNDTVMKMEKEKDNEQLSETEKLARIRNKYHQNRLRRPPEIIEAKPLSLRPSNKVPAHFFEDFQKILCEWCGPETICYLRYRCRVDSIGDENEVVDEAAEARESICLLSLESVDQTKQRISVLNELLKPSWRILEGTLNINGCGQQALKIISTFRLSAENVVLERKTCNLAVAVIFRLLAYCDTSLMDFFPSGGVVSSELMRYLEQIGCDVNYYFENLSVVINKLK